MRDEFRGNFSKDAFNETKYFSRVLMQQGRVLLDSDLNELQDLVTYYMRELAKDVIGPHGGLKDDAIALDSFIIKEDTNKNDSKADITIGPGRYYVDGILCINNKLGPENSAVAVPIYYRDQDGYISDPALLPFSDGIPPLQIGKNLIYLDVWERSINYIQDESLIESALGIGDADTAVRSQVVWQIKAWADTNVDCQSNPWHKWNDNRGLLIAKIDEPKDDSIKDCIVSQGAQLTVPRNLLIRVEIHQSGIAGGNPPATFKWSCINGSADFKVSRPIKRSDETVGKKNDLKLDVATVTLDSPLDSGHLSLEKDDIVEIVDDTYVLARKAFPMWRVDFIDTENNQVILKRKHWDYKESVGEDITKNPLLRRWDQKQGDTSVGGLELLDDNAAKITEYDSSVGSKGSKDDRDQWLNLGMGVAVQFQRLMEYEQFYHTGDYWLIPVRTLTGVKWPKEALPPHGIKHHYAPLAVATLDEKGNIAIEDPQCRLTFIPATSIKQKS